MNIVLIGMPTAGKSTIGEKLARLMGYDFIDSDLVIQSRENRLLNEIIEQEGMDSFISIENRINASLCVDDTVIATGGSVIYGVEAMTHLKDIGIIVYLKLSYETIDQRLGNVKQRGVVFKENQSLLQLYQERCPIYESYADIIIDAENLGIDELVVKITEQLPT